MPITSSLSGKPPERKRRIAAEGGQREVLIPDFVIGANALYYAGRLLTTNPRDFFKAFPALEVLTPLAFPEQYAPTPQPPEEPK